ncbi:MAG TPA: porin family protein [Bacteroidales bacterium]|nr:porin family protein [Bacteroidales bacterium]
MKVILHRDIKWILLSIILLLIPAVRAFSQENCADTLRKAQKLYEQGIIEEIPPLIKPCLEEGFNRSDKIKAYKLLIMSYIFDDNQTSAEKTMLSFLKDFPEYETKPDDPVEFVYLFNSYKIIPVWSLGVSGGPGISMVHIIESYGTQNLNAVSTNYNPHRPGFNAGIDLHIYLKESFELNTGIRITNYHFSGNDNSYDFLERHYEENQLYLQLPVTVSYEFDKNNKINPYLEAGIVTGWLIKDVAKFNNHYTDNSHLDVTGPEYQIKKQRKSIVPEAIAGVGLRYNLPAGYFVFGIYYHVGLLNQVVASSRITPDSETLFKYYHIDDNFSINNLNVRFGYVLPFYKARKEN